MYRCCQAAKPGQCYAPSWSSCYPAAAQPTPPSADLINKDDVKPTAEEMNSHEFKNVLIYRWCIKNKNASSLLNSGMSLKMLKIKIQFMKTEYTKIHNFIQLQWLVDLQNIKWDYCQTKMQHFLVIAFQIRYLDAFLSDNKSTEFGICFGFDCWKIF